LRARTVLLTAGLRAGARLLPGRLVLPRRPLGRGPALLRARSTSARASLSALRRRRARPRREGAAGGWALAREPSALPPRAAAARGRRRRTQPGTVAGPARLDTSARCAGAAAARRR